MHATYIQLNEKHLSPHATTADLQPIMTTLKALGWPVEYSPGSCLWHFGSYHQMRDFEKDFEMARDTAAGPDFTWNIWFPCDCSRALHDLDQDCPCEPIEEQVHERHEFDFEPIRKV